MGNNIKSVLAVRFVFIAFAFLSLPASVHAATPASYYASPSGTGTTCSTTSPCSLSTANSSAQPGDTVYLKGGTYTQRLLITRSGAAGAFITFAAAAGETPVIDGASFSGTSSSGMVNITANYIRIDGLTVINAPVAAIYANTVTNLQIINNKTNNTIASSGIGVWWSDQVLVSHNTVINSHMLSEAQGGHEESVSIAGTTNFEVSYNEIYMSGQTAYLGNAGIDCKDGARFGLVHHNYLHDYPDEDGGIYIDAWDSLTGNIDIYNNRLSNTATGITVGSEQGGTAENVRIYNNVIYNVGSTGINIPTRSTAGIRRNIEIYNNTIYKARWNGGAGIYIVEPKISNIIIRNNIVSFNNTNGEITAGSSSLLQYISADHNLVFGSKSCAQDYPNCVEIPGSTTADPKFVSLTSPDFHLQSSSPGINMGTPVSLVTADYDGNPRPQGTGYDIGAYEYTGGVISTPTGAPTPTPTSTPTKTPTKTPTPTPTKTPTPTSALKPGDATGDGRVDEADYAIWLAHYGQHVSGGASVGDFNPNPDGVVDGIDFSIWITHYGS